MSGKKLTGRRRNSISVCYLIDVSPGKFNGGGQVHLANLVRQMQIQNSEFPGLASARPRAGRIQNYIFGGPSSHTVIRFLWCFWVTGQVVFFHFFRRRFDLIHAHSVPAMAAGKILSLVLGIPIVVTVHGSWMKSWLEKFVLTKVKYDVQITVARNFLEVPNVNKNIVYIPNGVDLDKFRKLHIRRGSLRNFNLLFVGRKNDPVKGFGVLEEAMKLVKQEIPEAKLLAADGSVSGDEVTKMYFRANLFVLPSLSEGFPLTLLEAWAARLPVVATAVGEVRSFANFSRENSLSEVCETSWGYVVEPGNPKALAKGIIRALKNPGLAKLGENGYNLAKECTWERVARETLAVYQKIC